MKKMKTTIFLVLFLLCAILSAHGQLQEKDNLLGATLGLWAHNHVPTIGVNYEYQLTQAGIGTISLGGILKYYSWTDNYHDGDSRKYTFTTLGIQSNYNFNQIGDGKFVPFLGLVISYNSVNETYTDVHGHGVYYTDIAYTSGAWIWAQTGMRYFFTPNVAGAVRLNLGNNDFYTIELGVDFKF
jgi:hypothetical protein